MPFGKALRTAKVWIAFRLIWKGAFLESLVWTLNGFCFLQFITLFWCILFEPLWGSYDSQSVQQFLAHMWRNVPQPQRFCFSGCFGILTFRACGCHVCFTCSILSQTPVLHTSMISMIACLIQRAISVSEGILCTRVQGLQGWGGVPAMNSEGVTVTGAEECPVDKFWGNGLGEKVGRFYQRTRLTTKRSVETRNWTLTDNTLQVSSVRVVRWLWPGGKSPERQPYTILGNGAAG